MTGKGEKGPGHFGRRATRHHWRDRSAAWDVLFDQLSIARNAERLEAAREQTVAQAEELQGIIGAELKELQQVTV